MNSPTQLGGGLDTDETAKLLLNRRQSEEVTDEEAVEETEGEVLDQPEPEGEDDQESEDDDSEETQEEEQEEDAEQDEVASFENISELAEALGLSEDDFLSSIKTRTKVDGEESEVTLADLTKGYQLEANFTRKNQAFIEEKHEFEKERDEARTKLNTDLEQTGRYFQLAQQQLTHEYNAIDWNALQQSDPAQWSIQRQKFSDRQAQINHTIDQATQTAQAAVDKQKQEQEQKDIEFAQKEQELLLAAVPEWQNDAVRAKADVDLSTFLGGMGFTDSDLPTFTDHRFILLARQAMSATQQATQVELAKKKIKKLPKFVKPSARQDKGAAKAKNISSLRNKAIKSGKTTDLQQLLLAKRK